MRYVFDTNGNNVTANVQATILSATVLPLADLFTLQYVHPTGAGIVGVDFHYNNLYMTSAPFPIAVNKLQKTSGPNGVATVNAVYQPARISRGAFEYAIGFEDTTCDVTWFIDDSFIFGHVGFTDVPWGWKYALLQGYFDEYPMWIHRAIFAPPTTPNGAPVLLGTTLMWRGFIRDVKADRGKVVITLASLMHVFQNVQIPTQTIQPGDRRPPYFPANIFIAGDNVPGVAVLGTSTPTELQVLRYSVPDHHLRDSYLSNIQSPGHPYVYVATNGEPQPYVFRIRDNVTNNTPQPNTLHIYPYEPINPYTMGLFNPGNLNDTTLVIYYPISPDTAGANGFPYVPPPEVSF
jgi:hypothetical protein